MAVSLSEISPRDTRTQAQMDALLEQEGIRRDRNLDYSCGVFDDGELIACGSSFHNTLRCLAVSSDHRGEGLMNQVVSHLMERQVNLGNSHVFLYTKVKNERIFPRVAQDLNDRVVLREKNAVVERFVDPASERRFDIRKIERHSHFVERVAVPGNLDDNPRVVSVQSPAPSFVTIEAMTIGKRELARD